MKILQWLASPPDVAYLLGALLLLVIALIYQRKNLFGKDTSKTHSAAWKVATALPIAAGILGSITVGVTIWLPAKAGYGVVGTNCQVCSMVFPLGIKTFASLGCLCSLLGSAISAVSVCR